MLNGCKNALRGTRGSAGGSQRCVEAREVYWKFARVHWNLNTVVNYNSCGLYYCTAKKNTKSMMAQNIEFKLGGRLRRICYLLRSGSSAGFIVSTGKAWRCGWRWTCASIVSRFWWMRHSGLHGYRIEARPAG
jgi:hypothetical protein